MHGFLIEKLFPTGWRRTGELYWRFADAVQQAEQMVLDHEARGVRILPVRVAADAVWENIPEPAVEAAR